MKVYQRLAQAFKAEGVSATFGMMGDGNLFWLAEMHKLGIKVHEVRHEGAGLGMADGWARVTRQPGVAVATCGPGTTQLATAFVTAARASTPLVAFCGEYPTVDDENSQRLDHARFAGACEAGFVRLATADGTDEAVRKAFWLARTESRPVMLSVPMDIQMREFEDDDPYMPSSALFTPGIVHPDPRALRAATDIIATSKKPVIIVGRGAKWSGAGKAVVKLAERIGAVIATTLMAKTWLNEHDYHAGISGNYASKTAMAVLQQADCVIGVGASLNRYTTENGYLYADARFIQIDIKSSVMMSGVRAADCYVQSDARLGVEELERLLAGRGYRSTGFRTPEVKARLARHFEDTTEFPMEPDTVDPRRVCMLLDEIVPAHVGLISGTGMIANISNTTMHRQRPLTEASHFFSCIGQMFPAAMGAIVATGNRPLMMIEGDASLMMHLSEFETAVRYDMPLLVVVMNNEALGPEYYKLESKKMDTGIAVVKTPNLGVVAQGLGGKGALARSLDELRAAVLEWVAAPCPMIIDVRVSRTVLPIPYRRLYHGRDE
jgi:thiamine pyrophosphate-dependent acetolactate synthase large subunit-like protein